MAHCHYCGENISFRYVNGSCIPIHPSGQCMGGSFSNSYHYRGFETFQYHDQDICSPTNCPECGDEVFFIRHNGGSVWLDPPLGWPWPKHPCMDTDYISVSSEKNIKSLTHSRSIHSRVLIDDFKFVKKIETLDKEFQEKYFNQNIIFGVITRAGNPFTAGEYTGLGIICSDGKGRTIAVKNPKSGLLGAAVILDLKAEYIYTFEDVIKIEYLQIQPQLLGLSNSWLIDYKSG